MAAQVETYQFQAETKQLLDIMIHSLYTTKEIFLRELISNASDALDRLGFESLTNPELTAEDSTKEIRLEVDTNERTLTISDSGIGMSREEVIQHIGTIAKSGTRELREKMREGASTSALEELIGQFGVGFYSAFMVADRVTLVTRRAGEQRATRWESTGDGQYTISDAERPTRGTSITLHLKPVDHENGIEDYTDKWTLSRIVKRHSDYVNYPILFDGEALNSMKPLWGRPASEVSEAEYSEFYKHISHDFSDPLYHFAARAEGLLEYQALIFFPSKAPYDLFYHGFESGLRLYAKGVLIMEQCPDLLPHYLRFLKGLVDSENLPLNISRQMLQQDRQIAQIRKWLTKKSLDALQHLFDKEFEKYVELWKQFGRALKEGAATDFDNKDRIVSLLLFESSHDAEKLTTLKDYVGRMPSEQSEIFYLTGESRTVVENSPHLEAFKAKGYEVLYLVDTVDELLVQYLTEFEGKRLKSVGKGTVNLGSEEEQAQVEEELKKEQEESAGLLQSIQQHLDQYLKEVRLTNRLTNSPVCLVGGEMDFSPQMERLLQMSGGERPKQKRIMELNPRHEIVRKMRERYAGNADDPKLGKYAELLYGYALLAEGSDLPDPPQFNRLLAELLSETLTTA
ncbi:MAG TPA: molecular chaperone HtpG [Pyrinomonadaceae bacterium]|jgi:molecular chaperone HtpG|nr:molecular chaperone HtpG [Pyrinomonadaceae bacterium]